jgi:hypothetical protein
VGEFVLVRHMVVRVHVTRGGHNKLDAHTVRSVHESPRILHAHQHLLATEQQVMRTRSMQRCNLCVGEVNAVRHHRSAGVEKSTTVVHVCVARVLGRQQRDQERMCGESRCM